MEYPRLPFPVLAISLHTVLKAIPDANADSDSDPNPGTPALAYNTY